MLEPGDEFLVFPGVQTALQGVHQSVEIVKNNRRCVEPETGKHGTPQCPIVRWIKPLMAFVAKHKPIDLAVEDAPDQVFANLVPEVSSELTVQVVSRVLAVTSAMNSGRRSRSHPDQRGLVLLNRQG